MGYRSEVAYVIAFPNDAELASFLAQAKALSGQPMQPSDVTQAGLTGQGVFNWGDMSSALDECQIKFQEADGVETPLIAFYCDQVKWYEADRFVYAHESLLSLARVNYQNGGNQRDYNYRGNGTPPHTCTKISAEFMRIGEDDDDIVHENFGISYATGNMYVERKIGMWTSLEKILKTDT